jgi:hypothetical protein
MKTSNLLLVVLSIGLSGIVLLTSCKKDNASSNANKTAIVATWTLTQGTLINDYSAYGQPNTYDTVQFTAPHQDTLIFTNDGHVIDITYPISFVGSTPAGDRYSRFADTISYKFINDTLLQFNGFTPTVSYVDAAPSVTILQLTGNKLIMRNRMDTTTASTQSLFFTR